MLVCFFRQIWPPIFTYLSPTLSCYPHHAIFVHYNFIVVVVVVVVLSYSCPLPLERTFFSLLIALLHLQNGMAIVCTRQMQSKSVESARRKEAGARLLFLPVYMRCNHTSSRLTCGSHFGQTPLFFFDLVISSFIFIHSFIHSFVLFNHSVIYIFSPSSRPFSYSIIGSGVSIFSFFFFPFLFSLEEFDYCVCACVW